MNYFNYFTEIEDAFVRRRGKHLFLSPLDWALMEVWRQQGIPLHIVLRGVGAISESDVLLAVTGNTAGFMMTAGTVMKDKLVTIDVHQPLMDLVPVFERGRVAAILDQGQFLGLITPIDFLNHLPKRTGHA